MVKSVTLAESVVIIKIYYKDILRSLAKTVLVRLLAKKQVQHQDWQGSGLDQRMKFQVSKLVKEKNICASEIMSDLNRQVRKWGLDVRYRNLTFKNVFIKTSPFGLRCVSLSEAKVLKKPEGNNGIAPLLQVSSSVNSITS